MLNIKLLFLLLLASGSLFAQPFHKIPSSGAWWRISHSVYLSQNEQYQSRYLQYTDGDTTVGGYLAQRVCKTADSVCFRSGGCPGFADSVAFCPYGLIYQDSVGKISSVWPNGTLHLMYDFGAMPGAMVVTFSGPNYEIDSVSIITYADGIPRRMQHVKIWTGQSAPLHGVLVEGIGDLQRGLFPGPYEYEGQNGLECFNEDQVPVAVATQQLCNPPSCASLVGTKPAQKPQNLMISPNPSTSGVWRIADTDRRLSQGGQAKVTDLSGRVIYEHDFRGNELLTLEFNSQPGAYILSLRLPGGAVMQSILVHL